VALETAQFTMNWYAEFFDEEYPISKLDLIGIPDFAAGFFFFFKKKYSTPFNNNFIIIVY
jgi:hypothetical protein